MDEEGNAGTLVHSWGVFDHYVIGGSGADHPPDRLWSGVLGTDEMILAWPPILVLFLSRWRDSLPTAIAAYFEFNTAGFIV